MKQICASDPFADTCQGDSGGPMILEESVGISRKYKQIGIVGFGFGCNDVRFPGVYLNVAQYLGWIKEVTKGEDVWSDDCEII